VRVIFHGTKGYIEEFNSQHKLRTCIEVRKGDFSLLIDCGDPENYQHVLEADAVVTSHCFDSETEIFTNTGWKKFPELTSEDRIATLDDDGYLAFEKPVDYIEQDYEGLMYRLHTDYLDMCVTPNHKLYVVVNPRGFVYLTPFQRDPQYPDYSAFRAVPARDAFGKVKRFKSSFKWRGDNLANVSDLETWVELLGWLLSEGHASEYQVTFASENKTYVDRVCLLWSRLGVNPRVYSKINHVGKLIFSVVVSDKLFASGLATLGRIAREKKVPLWLKQLPPDYLRLFLQSCFQGDGTYGGSGTAKQIMTGSKQMADDLQELILKIGDSAKIEPRKGGVCTIGPNAPYKCRDFYVVKWYVQHQTPLDRHRSNRLSKRSFEGWVPYRGKVYCVTLPDYTNHTVLVRREGRVHWSMNSHPDHVDGFRGHAIEVPFYMSKETSERLPNSIEVLRPYVCQPMRRYSVGPFTIRLVPCWHSVRAPMTGVIIDNYLGVFTDIIAPKGGWDKIKDLKVYIGDGSAGPKVPIIRYHKELREPFGHTSFHTQLVHAKAYGWRVYISHVGRRVITKGEDYFKKELKEFEFNFVHDGEEIRV